MQHQDVRTKTGWRATFEIGSTVVMLVIGITVVWEGRARLYSAPSTRLGPAAPAVPSAPLRIADSAIMGSHDAKIAMIEYSDYECPACGEFARNIEPALRHEYVDTGRLIFAFKNFPLPIHPQAPTAAAAAWCAGRQGRFWQMHDLLFATPGRLQEADLKGDATAVGIDLEQYSACRSGDEAGQHVGADLSEARGLGFPATPSFFFGTIESVGQVKVTDTMSGARGISDFRTILDKLLK